MKNIGVMLDWKVLKLALAGKQTYERLSYYKLLGEKLGLEPIFYHPRQVNLKTREVRGLVLVRGRLVSKRVKIPRVMHNRVLEGNPLTKQMIRKLGTIGRVYNGLIVRNKLSVHRLLFSNSALRPHLPISRSYTWDGLMDLLGQYQVVYLKPVIGSVGQGVVRIERSGSVYLWTSSSIQQKPFLRSGLRQQARKWVGNRRFLIQQGIKLAHYKDRTFDIRVSIQKNGKRLWSVSGMVAKLANRYNKLSNLAQGGSAEKLDTVLLSMFSEAEVRKIKLDIARVGILIAKQLELKNPSLADIGIDMGIDSQGKPYMIEVNVRDQRYSFFKAGELGMFRKTYQTPLEYGKSLLEGRLLSQPLLHVDSLEDDVSPSLWEGET
ncbi:YheC/YheD family protein [Brevibacillus sp. B_LB10_24]|uniref:YheC/YheD family endospore coat-associated protein n=1 Tax=Brevibacillus sp. B_LB10_24 TaxID=3380645 RepID=UPI0038B81528